MLSDINVNFQFIEKCPNRISLFPNTTKNVTRRGWGYLWSFAKKHSKLLSHDKINVYAVLLRFIFGCYFRMSRVWLICMKSCIAVSILRTIWVPILIMCEPSVRKGLIYLALKGHGQDFVQILFCCFHHLQCFWNAFLLNKWNLRVSPRDISQIQISQFFVM